MAPRADMLSTQKATTVSSASRAWLLLIGLAIAYSPSYVNVVLRHLGVQWEFIRGPQSVLLWNWLAVALLAAFILWIERRTLASIGFKRPSGQDIQWALVFWGLSLTASAAVTALLPPPQSQGMSIVLSLPIPVLIGIIITTATTEEILFRGYPVERLAQVTGHLWIGAAVSFSLFILPHLVFFGPYWLLQQGIGVVLAYVLYLWRRNLIANMLMHLLGNAMLLVPALGLAG